MLIHIKLDYSMHQSGYASVLKQGGYGVNIIK